MKIGRNEPCWCGSGVKYKKCHLGRAKQSAIGKEQIHKTLNSFNSKKCCSAPSSLHGECTTKIIKAHSVSKSSSLKEIAVNGHVLTTFRAKYDFSKSSKITPKSVGINQASTFTGFCSRHDNELFSAIEDEPFDSSEYHCFLVAYRAVARELFTKEAASNVFGLLKDLDKGKSLAHQVKIQEISKHFSGNNDLTMGDLSYIKAKLDNMLLSKNYDGLEHIVFELNYAPSVMASAVLGSEIDFNGGVLQTPSSDQNDIPDYLSINSFASQGHGYIVISWLSEHSTCSKKLITQLLKKESISNSLAMFMFALIENIYMCPAWWERLGEELQNYVCDVYSQGVSKHTDVDVLVSVPDIKIAPVSKWITVNCESFAL
ncbi:YecA family protein [Marinobacter nauticus]|jgi:hypothetical protein|uniref:YecA family protein n=1 Tax=Marinobacter nauticus TaxID=2743 RepID=UPI0003158123|nr:SEC-C domain-containing protein [Marinobacter nauticus]